MWCSCSPSPVVWSFKLNLIQSCHLTAVWKWIHLKHNCHEKICLIYDWLLFLKKHLLKTMTLSAAKPWLTVEALSVISIKFLLGISMLYEIEQSWELRNCAFLVASVTKKFAVATVIVHLFNISRTVTPYAICFLCCYCFCFYKKKRAQKNLATTNLQLPTKHFYKVASW